MCWLLFHVRRISRWAAIAKTSRAAIGLFSGSYCLIEGLTWYEHALFSGTLTPTPFVGADGPEASYHFFTSYGPGAQKYVGLKITHHRHVRSQHSKPLRVGWRH